MTALESEPVSTLPLRISAFAIEHADDLLKSLDSGGYQGCIN